MTLSLITRKILSTHQFLMFMHESSLLLLSEKKKIKKGKKNKEWRLGFWGKGVGAVVGCPVI